MQLGLEKLMNNKGGMAGKSHSHQNSQFDIDTKLLTIEMSRLRILEKIRDIKHTNVKYSYFHLIN